MFTGLIEELGRVASVSRPAAQGEPQAAGSKIVIAASHVTGDLAAGDSIAVNGVCLTALDPTQESFAADVSPETLNVTTLGHLTAGSPVNLERAATPTTRLGGHIVQGHVDARGQFLSVVAEGDFYTVRIAYPSELARYLVHKGSIAVEGISLTIAALAETHFDLAIIPKTWEMTNLHSLASGDPVNLEVDMIAKYVERLLGFSKPVLP